MLPLLISKRFFLLIFFLGACTQNLQAQELSPTTLFEQIMEETRSKNVKGLYATWKVEGTYLTAIAIRKQKTIQLRIIQTQEEAPLPKGPLLSLNQYQNWLDSRAPHISEQVFFLEGIEWKKQKALSENPLTALFQVNVNENLLSGDFWRPTLSKKLTYFPEINKLIEQKSKLPHFHTDRKAWSWKAIKTVIPVSSDPSESPLPTKATLYFLMSPTYQYSLCDCPPLSLPFWIQMHHSVRPTMMSLDSAGWIAND